MALSMRLNFKCERTLPDHAWAVMLRQGVGDADCVAGSKVLYDSAQNAFWEGLAFAPDDLSREPGHHFALSTGAIARDGGVQFWTPGHIFDRLFIVESKGRIVVSNSMPFALKASGTSLVPDHLHYPWDLGRIVAHEQFVPIRGGHLRVISNANVTVTPSGEITVEMKPAGPGFSDFSSYRAALDRFIDEVATANKRHPLGPYKPLATVSTGYDSPAATVFAQRLGATEALTFVDSRGGTPGDDSGEGIAQILGLSVKTASRSDYTTSGWDAERLFYVFGLPEDISFYPFAGELEGSILFTGLQGDTMWIKYPYPLGAQWSWDPGGATMQEFRLRTGFVHLPPAFFGWRHQDELIRITNSDEMAPWTLGVEYDRPIPRRIVEERGIRRDMFGMDKKAITATFGIDNDRYLGPESLGISAAMRKRLDRHAADVTGLGMSLEMGLANGAHSLVRLAHRAARGMRKSGSGTGKPDLKNKTYETMQAVDAIVSVRRKFMQPFSNLNFSCQIANEDLAADYVTFP